VKYLLGLFISILVAAEVWFASGYIKDLRAFLRARAASDARGAARARFACRRDLIGMVVSIVIGMLGSGLFLENALRARPVAFVVYWLVVLVLTLWVLLLGLFDMREVLRSFRQGPPKR